MNETRKTIGWLVYTRILTEILMIFLAKNWPKKHDEFKLSTAHLFQIGGGRETHQLQSGPRPVMNGVMSPLSMAKN